MALKPFKKTPSIYFLICPAWRKPGKSRLIPQIMEGEFLTMCRLLAVSCSRNVDISYSMRRFRDLVYDDPVLPRGNEDDWGIAIWNPKWKMKGDKREDFASETHWMEIYRSENSVSDDSLRYNFYQMNVRAGTYLLHVRFISKTSESTKGGLDPRLNHPYFFKLGDFCLAFAHNGTIHDKEQLLKKSKSFTLPKADRIKQGRYTDSEAAFVFDKDITECLGRVDREDWEFAISATSGNIVQAAKLCGLSDIPKGAKALWGKSAEEARGIYRRWQKKKK